MSSQETETLTKIVQLLTVAQEEKQLLEKRQILPEQAFQDIREWFALHVKSLNEKDFKLSNQAIALRQEIEKKYNLSANEIVGIAEGKTKGEWIVDDTEGQGVSASDS